MILPTGRKPSSSPASKGGYCTVHFQSMFLSLNVAVYLMKLIVLSIANAQRVINCLQHLSLKSLNVRSANIVNVQDAYSIPYGMMSDL